jgi:L-ribulokinase
VDHDLSGLVVGLTLATRPEDLYRALVESTAYGARTIVEAFGDAGVPVKEFVVAGGLAKNPMLMQIYADVLNMPLSVVGSEQAPALGSAIHAAVAAGAYPDVAAASRVMGRLNRNAYEPVPANAKTYDALYAEYTKLHDHFGRGGNDVMHRLGDLRREAHAAQQGAST